MDKSQAESSGRPQKILASVMALISAVVLGYYLYWLMLWAPDTPSWFTASHIVSIGFLVAAFLFLLACVLSFVRLQWGQLCTNLCSCTRGAGGKIRHEFSATHNPNPRQSQIARIQLRD